MERNTSSLPRYYFKIPHGPGEIEFPWCLPLPSLTYSTLFPHSSCPRQQRAQIWHSLTFVKQHLFRQGESHMSSPMVSQECRKCLSRKTDTIIPMGLANDNWWGYTSCLLFKHQVALKTTALAMRRREPWHWRHSQ